jgi:8-oxo-dGTP diphosphatase
MTRYFVVNVEAAIFRDGKWLVGVRSKKESEAAGLLSFVGGTIDDTDTTTIDILESGLIREVKEEVGIDVKVLNFVNNTTFVSKRGNNVLNIVFLCSVDFGEPKVSDTVEFDELLWLTRDEILQYPNVPQWLCNSLIKAESLLGG